MELTVIGFWIVLAITAWVLADKKNRCSACWAIGTLLFAPVILILLALPAKEQKES